MSSFFENIFNNLNLFDICVSIIFIYSVIQCYLKGFSLSLISFMKWVISIVITIILVPKLQPIVSDYVESQFINNFGLGFAIFVFTLFLTIVIGKTLGKAITWTGVGSIDKTHPNSPSSPSTVPPTPVQPKINSGSPTVKVLTVNGDFQPVARIGDTLECGCTIMGGGNTVGGGANG